MVCRQFADRRFGDGRKGAGRILDRRKYAYIYLLFFRPIYIYIYYTLIQCQFYLKSYQNHTDSYIIKIQNQILYLLFVYYKIRYSDTIINLSFQI